MRFGVVFLQGHRHAVGGVEDRQGVVERQVLAQQQDQLLPETVAADLFDGAAQAGVHADVPEQGVHPYSLHGGFSQAPVCGFSTRRVRGVTPKGDWPAGSALLESAHNQRPGKRAAASLRYCLNFNNNQRTTT